MLMRQAVTQPRVLRVLGADDFALKRRHHYTNVIIAQISTSIRGCMNFRPWRCGTPERARRSNPEHPLHPVVATAEEPRQRSVAARDRHATPAVPQAIRSGLARLCIQLGQSLQIGSAKDVGLITEVGDDLQLAAERLDIGSQGVDLTALQLALLDA